MSASSQSTPSNQYGIDVISPVNGDGVNQAESSSKRTCYALAGPNITEAPWHNSTQNTAIDYHGSPPSLSHSAPSTVHPKSTRSISTIPHATPQVNRDLGSCTDLAILPSEEHSEEESEPEEESEQELRALTNHGLGHKWIAESESEPENYSEEESENINEDNMSVSEVRNMLMRNRMYVNDPEARKRGQILVKKAMEVIDERRISTMTGKEADKIRETLEFFSTKNEKTLLINLWGVLLKETRFSKKKLPSGEEAILSPEEEVEAGLWIEKAWRADDKLWTKWDATFLAETLPEIATTGNSALDELLAKVPRVGKPVPDICIGFDTSAFSTEVMAVLQEFGCTVTTEQWISLFALVAKGADESIDVASNQCSRSGAAMVKNIRDFFKATNAWLSIPPPTKNSASRPDQSAQLTQAEQSSQSQQAVPAVLYPRPDMQSFAFSAALSPQQVILYVHWAEEIDEDTEIWHQTRLRDYSLYKTEDLEQLRCNLDNIFDWGISTRKRKVEAQCEQYLEHYDKLNAALRKAASKKAKDAVESHCIKRQGTESGANKKRKAA
ncbi:MAG: hypothetical protein L6R38_009585 [Xanthoria sp. 2 TBL-2021]|nr:MAG: hypothetical protein L6R38_009585 [Xanthoria sp. 2 TBL-2021]